MRTLGLLFLIFTWSTSLQASSDPTRSLLHILDYIAADYPFAVSNGQVVQAGEYDEQSDFIRQAGELLPAFLDSVPEEVKQNALFLLQDAQQKISLKQSADSLQQTLSLLRKLILQNTKVPLYPLALPDITRGKNIYVSSCARCHGSTGMGDGPDAVGLDPKPQNLSDSKKMFSHSPLSVFNTVRLGIPGTSMLPHPSLSDKQVWDVSAYVLSLPYTDEVTSIVFDSFPLTLAEYATMSHQDLLSIGSMDTNLIASIRLYRPSIPVSRQKEYLISGMEDIIALYQSGKYQDAQWLSSDLYFERIEALETALAATPELKTEMETIFFRFRNDVRKPGNITRLKESLQLMKEIISKIPDNPTPSPFSVAFLSASVVFREALEAFLLLTIILSIIQKTGMQYTSRFLHAGWLSALAIGLSCWFVLGKVITRNMPHVELMEGIVSLLSAGILLFIGFWLHKRSSIQEWTRYVKERVSNNLFKNNHFGIFALSFMIVFREVFESLLFLSALQIQSAGASPYAVFGGATSALILVGFLAFLTIRFSVQLPIQKLFFWSMLLMSLLAIVLTGKGIHAFQEAGWLTSHIISLPTIEWLGIYPYWETIAAQLSMAVLIVFLRFKTR